MPVKEILIDPDLTNPVADPLAFTPKELAALSGLADKLLQRVLRDALVEILTPAIKKSFSAALSDIVTVKKPGGGQEGGANSEKKAPDGGG